MISIPGSRKYILGGSVDTKLLDVRVFDEATKKSIYSIQTTASETKGESNCPLCALGHDANPPPPHESFRMVV